MSQNTHQLTLTPSDVLFFRDGRPMEGSSIGHGAAWPLPNILDSALHHALRRSGEISHTHTPKRSGKELNSARERHFGSLQTAGPFPILNGVWYFPRPTDADKGATAQTTHKPLKEKLPGTASSLNDKLTPVANTQPPSKEKSERWLSSDAYQDYLNNSGNIKETDITDEEKKIHFLNDSHIFAAEHNIGIGIDPNSGTTIDGAFYSASYLRLKENAHLGLLAKCQDKDSGDLISKVFPNSGVDTKILAGGQQRTCGVERVSPEKLTLPMGTTITGHLVRWTLLTPAIFPEILENREKGVPCHPGGWLPSWIDAEMHVQLKDSEASKRQSGEGRVSWRKRVKALNRINARLVAAIIPRAIPVTGWATHDTDDQSGKLISTGGARATHLAVPAGAVYYFEAESKEEAEKLADALNWHGTTSGTEIINRRSSLMGEKGFGLGVCSNFNYHQ